MGINGSFELCHLRVTCKQETHLKNLGKTQARMHEFPGGPAVTNLPCNAADTGSIPGRRVNIPHALEKRSLCTTAGELCATSKDPACDEQRLHEVQIRPRKPNKLKKKKEEEVTVKGSSGVDNPI